jgi:hypothetical protein
MVADLRRIETEARALPALAPSRELWDGISARIQAPVIALPPARAGASDAPRRRPQWIWMSAAAAALVVVTAGLTYAITATVLGRTAPSAQIASNPQPTPGDVPVVPPDPPGGARVPDDGMTQNPERRTQGDRPASRAPESRPRVRNVSGPMAAEDMPLHVADASYAKEIAYLERLLERRRDLLDTATVAVLERNFAVIDAAIAESRAALASDPASAFLNDQLKIVLERKLELLRTAATLPARSE